MFFKTWSDLGAEKQRLVTYMAALVAVVYGSLIWISASNMADNRMRASHNHQVRMTADVVERGHTPPEALPADGNFATVTVGTYLDNIDTFSIKDSSWSANFYIWFNWTGPKTLDPGGKMVVVDGIISKKDLLEEYHGDNDSHYQKYRVSAKFLKFFDTSRVPIESHMLNIYIEDGARDGTKLRYVADKSANISSRVQIPGYKVASHANVVKPHTYRSAYGDPRLPAGDKKTFTQYIVGIDIVRANMGVYGKIFLSLFAALALALSNFFVKPSDVGPRFSLPTAAYFGAVANSYVANSILPPSGSFGLVDYVAAFGLGTIFLTIALALLSNYIFVKKDDKALSYVLDRTMFFVLLACCLIGNIVIPWSAMG
ncbi:hypothetical protein A6A04_17560 [Paramagnetospirillum marisnigri]|uniref:Uncharacterized protein n=1 Tax=Paramagnetospirillum marisnigri TaxID=1285242 RepID=A0A178MPX0_9PROT|nr:hypothetical protein [Paramagnetospirillum marisnigri]OAN50756.1 hypothetical protein A6A04_17560 [Paramagnetospirillum marisnigri]